MSRKRRQSGETSAFKKLLGWTIVLALVFSAGLITGQRLLRRQAMPPLVSLKSTQKAEAVETVDTGEERLPTTFSFYEHLGKETPKTSISAEKTPKTTPKKAVVKEEAPKEEVAPKKVPASASESAAKTAKPAEEAKLAASAAPDPQEPSEVPSDKASEASTKDVVLEKVAEALESRTADGALPARYTLQVGSHAQKSSADTQIEKLEKMGLEPHVIMVEVPGRGRFYRVRIGRFHSMKEARSFQGEIQADRGVSTFVSPI